MIEIILNPEKCTHNPDSWVFVPSYAESYGSCGSYLVPAYWGYCHGQDYYNPHYCNGNRYGEGNGSGRTHGYGNWNERSSNGVGTGHALGCGGDYGGGYSLNWTVERDDGTGSGSEKAFRWLREHGATGDGRGWTRHEEHYKKKG